MTKTEIKITPSLIILGMFFVTLLIASNVTGAKLVDVKILGWTFTLSVALLFFPLTYVISDITTEVYGFRICRFLIWCGLICNILFLLFIYLAATIKPSIYFADQDAFQTTLMMSCRVFFASVVAFFIAEMINSILLSRLKVYLEGKLLPVRILFSTVSGVLFGSLIFYEIAFIGIHPQWLIMEMMFIELIVKILYDFCCLPITCYCCRLLKRLDGIDHYDYNIKYNPFFFWERIN